MLTYFFPFFAVLLGACLALYFRPNTPTGMRLLLAFSGAFLLGVLALEMLPKIYGNGDRQTGWWLLGGILLQILLEFFSKGAEHGHAHYHAGQKLPWILLISLGLHAFLEGLPLGSQPDLMWAVSVHKIPIAIVVTMLLWETKGSLTIKTVTLIFFALMSPFGSWIALNNQVVLLSTKIEPLVVGVLLHISTTILFESAEGHNFNLKKFISIVLGLVFAGFF